MVQVKLTSINFSHFFLYQRLFRKYHIIFTCMKRKRCEDKGENRIIQLVTQLIRYQTMQIRVLLCFHDPHSNSHSYYLKHVTMDIQRG